MKKIALIIMFFCMTVVNADDETESLFKEVGAALAIDIVGSILNSAIDDGHTNIDDGHTNIDDGHTNLDLYVNVNKLSPKEQRLYKDCKENKTATSTSSCEELTSRWQDGWQNVWQNEYGKARKELVHMLNDRYYEDCDKNNDIKVCDKWLNYKDKNRDIIGQQNKKEINALEKACRGGMPRHCQTLGGIYKYDKNYKKAIEFYTIGCDYANEDSCNSLKDIE